MRTVHDELKKISDTKWYKERDAHEKVKDLVSVCMPNFNKGKFLDKAIESIYKQTYQKIELIIVDDFSTDNSRAVLQQAVVKYRNRIKIRVVHSPCRRGTAWSQNIAYYYASGEYIANMDSDDYCHPERLRMQVDALKTKGWDVCGTNFQIFKDDPNCPITPDGGYWLKYGTEEIQDSYLFKRIHCTCFGSLMVKSKVIDTIGGMTKEFIGTEDYEIVHRMATKGFVIGNLREALYFYRSHSEQRSALFHSSSV